LKVIAATSDAEVARMAGVPDLTERAGGRARQFPVRQDLVQRLRWHVIRVEPVTVLNAEPTIRTLVDRVSSDAKRDWSNLKWSDEALIALKTEVISQIESKSKSFNHRREIVRIITLVNEHVSGGRKRGLRGFSSGEVSADIVQKFIDPVLPVTPESAEESSFKKISRNEQSSALLPEEINLRKKIEEIITSLSPHWNHLRLRDAVKADPTLVAPIQSVIKEALDPSYGEPCKFVRGPDTPFCGIAHSLSNGMEGNNWGMVKKQLNKAGIKPSEVGTTIPGKV
jgi:hypothetical protein